jgi:hypothetical protein
MPTTAPNRILHVFFAADKRNPGRSCVLLQ